MVSLKNSRRSRQAPAPVQNGTDGSEAESADEYDPTQESRKRWRETGAQQRSLLEKKKEGSTGKGRAEKFPAMSRETDRKRMPHRIPAYLQSSSQSCQIDGAEISDAQRKKSRGQNRALAIIALPPGQKFPLLINKLGQPYGPHAKDLTRYVGVVARDPSKAPLIYHTWRKLPAHYKDNVWMEIRNKFELPNKADLPEAFRCYVMDSFKKKLSDWRCVLGNIYNIHDTRDARMQACPKEIPQDQWKSLMGYFDTNKSKQQSSRNANSRSRQTMLRTLGTKSLACFRAEQSTDDGDGVDLPRFDVWIKTHTSARFPRGTKGTGPIINKLSNQASQLLTDAHEEPSPSNDMLLQELSKDYDGRARTYGLGAHVGDIDGSKPSRMSLLLQNEALEQLHVGDIDGSKPNRISLMLQNEALKQRLGHLEDEALMLQNEVLADRIRRLEQFLEAQRWRGRRNGA
ncbi:unnamed protein product [Victoria cruziana]